MFEPGALYHVRDPQEPTRPGAVFVRVPCLAPDDPHRPRGVWACRGSDDCPLARAALEFQTHPACPVTGPPAGLACPCCGDRLAFCGWFRLVELLPGAEAAVHSSPACRPPGSLNRG